MTVVAPRAVQSVAIGLAEAADRDFTWPGLGRRPTPEFTLLILADSAALAHASRGRAPGWGAGLAFPQARTIMLRLDQPDPAQTLHHELAHLVLRQSVKVRVPLWFDEGFAAWASGELGRMESLELNVAVATGRVPTLDELNRLLRGTSANADLAYTLSASAVAEIARRAPEGALPRLLDRLEQGESFDSALVGSTGLTEERFEDAWRSALKHRYSLLTWFTAGGVWLVIALSLGWLVWYRRWRDRPRRAALDVGWVVPEVLPEDEPVDPGAATQ